MIPSLVKSVKRISYTHARSYLSQSDALPISPSCPACTTHVAWVYVNTRHSQIATLQKMVSFTRVLGQRKETTSPPSVLWVASFLTLESTFILLSRSWFVESYSMLWADLVMSSDLRMFAAVVKLVIIVHFLLSTSFLSSTCSESVALSQRSRMSCLRPKLHRTVPTCPQCN